MLFTGGMKAAEHAVAHLEARRCAPAETMSEGLLHDPLLADAGRGSTSDRAGSGLAQGQLGRRAQRVGLDE